MSPVSLRSRTGRLAAAALAAAAGAAAWLAFGGPVLVVEDIGARRVLHRERVSGGEAFVLSYVHSSENIPVRGIFRIETDGTLALRETQFAGFGPGLPALKPGDAWAIRDGMIVAAGPATPLPEIRVRVAPITRHRLLTPAGREVDLSTLTGAGGAVRISVR